MLTIAYLANQFPSPLEPYVTEEIAELRASDVQVVPGSTRKSPLSAPHEINLCPSETICLQRIEPRALLLALAYCWRRFPVIRPFLQRASLGHESLVIRAKALLHTLLGVYYAALLAGRGIDHIHVHHGYFSAWIAMVAARLLGITYSVTLHGSDLLLGAPYLDMKLQQCAACFTISEYNREYILSHYPAVNPEKILLRRLGVNLPKAQSPATQKREQRFTMLAVGRLHPTKNFDFLLAVCALLKSKDFGFSCWIAGDGPEKQRLKRLAAQMRWEEEVHFLGYIPHENLPELYTRADLVVLTSRSEGIPVVLMEAMAHNRPVLAPSITGVPELVMDGQTGFLYEPGNVADCVSKVEMIRGSASALGPLRRAARAWVSMHFNGPVNTRRFAEILIRLASTRYAHSVRQ